MSVVGNFVERPKSMCVEEWERWSFENFGGCALGFRHSFEFLPPKYSKIKSLRTNVVPKIGCSGNLF